MDSFALEITDLTALQAFEAVQHLPYSLFLDSADTNHYNGRYSFIACFPVETIESKDGYTTVTSAQSQTTYTSDPFSVLRDRMALHEFTTKALYGLPPFQGGAAGFFGYDLGRGIEKLPVIAADNPDMIDMGIGIYDQIIAFDHVLEKSWIITHAADITAAAKKQQILIHALKTPPQTGRAQAGDVQWSSNFDQAAYESNVADVIEHIRAGDIFQANISQRFESALPQDFCAFTHYKSLRTNNPAPFAGFMNLGGIKISSASPEQFLFVQDGEVTTRPIKGTIIRSPDPATDRFLKNTLENSEKDRAENIMIVDLLRNDLSKSCEIDSIEVTSLCGVESFARVHHLVSSIRGWLHKKADAISLLRGCFPGGSITGAPKIRAMEIIEEMEPTRRGPYCGSMGYIGFDGTMDTNILIRTLVYEQGANANRVSFQVGGGITVESNPEEEYKETLSKARAIFESFEKLERRTDSTKTA